MTEISDRRPHRVLAVSTLGAPGAPLDVVLRWAATGGAGSLELRVGPDEPVGVHTSAAERARVRAAVEAADLRVLSVACYVKVGADTGDETVIGDLLAHLELAAALGARFLRVFPGAPIFSGPPDETPRTTEPIDAVDRRIVRRLAAVGSAATELAVAPAVETHDSHPRGADIARVLNALDGTSPGHPVGAIWDALHPFRVGEPVDRTAALLLPYLLAGRGYVQIKDVDSIGSLTPVPPGAGIVPLTGILGLLDAGGYRGPLSLEWEKAWYPDIPELPQALAATRCWLDVHPPAGPDPAASAAG